tara:strand:+ start:1354 stop:1704 length:351 start_codon:yes stop_codon:yes gene_type:complete
MDNLDLGKYGSVYMDTTDLFTAPDGMAIGAIYFIVANTINTLTAADTSAGNRRYFNTANTAHASGTIQEGTNGCQLDNTAAFTAGQIIYGRWETFKLETADSDGGVILYLVPKTGI